MTSSVTAPSNERSARSASKASVHVQRQVGDRRACCLVAGKDHEPKEVGKLVGAQPFAIDLGGEQFGNQVICGHPLVRLFATACRKLGGVLAHRERRRAVKRKEAQVGRVAIGGWFKWLGSFRHVCTRDRIAGAYCLTWRGVNAELMMRRSRVCTGGSMSIIDARASSASSSMS